MLDLDNPVHAGGMLGVLVGLLVIAIAMDMRRLPIGRIKWVPWTMLTIVLVLAVGLAARNLLLDLTR